jgi:hypothetical protein
MTEPGKLDSYGVQKVSSVLEHSISYRAAAKVLGVSHTALLRWLTVNRSQVNVRMGALAPKASEYKKRRTKWAGLLRWVRENPNVKLPRSANAIAILTGCTQDQVKTYLCRQRRIARSFVDSMPPLRDLPITVLTSTKESLQLWDLTEYRFVIDHWSSVVTIVGGTSNGPVSIPLPNVELFYKVAVSAHRAVTKAITLASSVHRLRQESQRRNHRPDTTESPS